MYKRQTELRAEGLLLDTDFQAVPDFHPQKVDFGQQFIWRNQMLERAYAHFAFGDGQAPELAAQFEAFKAAEASWLDDYALFMALKRTYGGLPWNAWEPAVRDRDPQALKAASESLGQALDRVKFTQFLFFRQWNAARAYAHERGIQIIGDIPIFVAMDSSDAWANRAQFYFDDAGQPTVVALSLIHI